MPRAMRKLLKSLRKLLKALRGLPKTLANLPGCLLMLLETLLYLRIPCWLGISRLLISLWGLRVFWSHLL